MPLSHEQRRLLEAWMRSKAILQLEEGDKNLTEDRGVVKVLCGNCGYVMLFGAATVGIRGSWARGSDL